MDDYYNQISESYDSLYYDEQKQKIELILQLLKKYKIELKNKKILDVGCGTGILKDFIPNIIGIDPSEKLIEIAKQKRKMECYLAPAENIPFQTDEFDLVISITAIQNFDNLFKALDEIKRVGNDKYVLTFLKKSEKKEEIEKIIEKIFNKMIEKIEEDKDIIYFVE